MAAIKKTEISVNSGDDYATEFMYHYFFSKTQYQLKNKSNTRMNSNKSTDHPRAQSSVDQHQGQSLQVNLSTTH